jgi:hypothetical protein
VNVNDGHDEGDLEMLDVDDSGIRMESHEMAAEGNHTDDHFDANC